MGQYYPLNWYWWGKIVPDWATPICTIVSGTSGKSIAYFIPYIEHFPVVENLLCAYFFPCHTKTMMFFKDFHFVEGSGVGTFLYLEWNIVPYTYWQLLLTLIGSIECLRSSSMPAGLVLRRSILMWPSCSRPMDVYLRPVRCAVSIAQNDPYITGDRICTNIHPCDHVPTYSRVDSTEKSKFFWKRP